MKYTIKNYIKQIRDILDKIEESNEEEKTVLHLEKENFKVNSDGWKKITVDGKKYLENDTKDIWELIDDYPGEQLFTWDAAMRETKKAGKRMPTDEEFSNGLDKELAGSPFVGFYYGGSYYYRGYGTYVWSSVESSGTYAWYRNLYYDNATVNRNNYYKTHGFSLRCIKD